MNKPIEITDGSLMSLAVQPKKFDEDYSITGYVVRVMANEPPDGMGKAKLSDSGFWLGWQAKLEAI